MSSFSYIRCYGGRYLSAGSKKNQIHRLQVLKQLLKGITPVGTAGISLNGLWDVIFKQPFLLPLSGPECWARCPMGLTHSGCYPWCCLSQLLSGSSCRCKHGLSCTPARLWWLELHSATEVCLTAVVWVQSTSVSGRKKKQKNIPAAYYLLPTCCLKLLSPDSCQHSSMCRHSLPWFCQAYLIQRILLIVQANLDHSRMQLGSKYVSNYGEKSEKWLGVGLQ